MNYPPARTVEVVEDVAGIPVPDPYRWLEEETPEVRAWQREQAALATSVIFDGVDRDAVRDLVLAYDAGSRPALPRYAAGLWFRASGSGVVASGLPYGEGREVLSLDEGVLSWLAPSPDGRVLAAGICRDGSEHNTIRLVEVDSGRPLDGPEQVLHSAWVGGVSWLPDSSGFYFFALTGSPEEFQQAVFVHRLGTGTAPEPVPVGTSKEYTLIQASTSWEVASHRVGSPIPIAVRRPGQEWRPFITDCAGTIAGHIVGDHYVAVTDVDAPRGRVVAIALDDPGDWTELVPEGDTVLRSLTPVGDRLYLSEFDQVFARVRILDQEGKVVGEVPLPGRGALSAPFFPLTGLAAGNPAPCFVFAFSTLTSSWGVYGHRPGGELDTLVAPSVTLDATIEEGRAIAPDGAAVPYHVVSGGSPGAPVLVSAYGAANVPLLPAYQPDLAAFVAAGGTLVQAYLRGGGEFGRDWWLAAHRERKHVRDADLVAVAEHLIATGQATAGRLALTGGSDGGLMCGVAVTTRPDLWRAVLPRAPLLDLIGGTRDPYLDFVIRKAWGDPDDPEDVRRFLRLSPYELIRPGTFPAVYLQAGATDPRCRPWHARKFAARLQAAQQGPAPILVHVFENAGHGAATGHDVAVEQDTEWLAFLIRSLGLRI
ncbi:prolyl oligopeptidase family serine peptidase [Nonomuraea sp. NPDC050663]|uniref:prolyl oligopeptidase family serine peptidase n=1 Tax=Nonomuraea sp. NPDC050663 TaxID=3364370 RepID=UPI00379F451C